MICHVSIYRFTVVLRNIIHLIYVFFQQQCDSQKSTYRSPSTVHTSSSGHHHHHQRQNRGQTFDCTEDNSSLNGVGMAHPLTYATIACVRRDGRYSRRPPRRQNSSETILPPPPSFYSADHPLIVSKFK